MRKASPTGAQLTLAGLYERRVVAATATGIVERRLHYDPFGARTNLYGDPLTTTPGDVQIGFNAGNARS